MIKWLLIYWAIGWAINALTVAVGLSINVKLAKKVYLNKCDNLEVGESWWDLAARKMIMDEHLDELEAELSSHLIFSNKILRTVETLIESRLFWPIYIVYLIVCLRRVRKTIKQTIEKETQKFENDIEIKFEVG